MRSSESKTQKITSSPNKGNTSFFSRKGEGPSLLFGENTHESGPFFSPQQVQRKTDTDQVNTSNEQSSQADAFSSQLNATKGGGQALPADISRSMGLAMGADFSTVRLHTDNTAAHLSRSIQAQAFAHGSDIYFNEGKYDPSSKSGKHLLAHELTHTVQQGGSSISRQAAPAATKLRQVKASGSRPGANFDSKVDVPSPIPSQGDMLVTMRININFQNTDLKFIEKNMLDTDKVNVAKWKTAIAKIQTEAPEKLKWSDTEKEKVRTDYQKNVDDVWSSESSGLTFKLDDAKYEKYKVKNNFKLEFTKKKPHHGFTVVKMIEGPVLRSYMGGTIGGFHDSRTFGTTHKTGKVHNMLSEQLGNFDNNSIIVTPAISAQIDALVVNINKIKEEHKKASPPPKWNISLTGRASKTGDKANNLKLSEGRANAVQTELAARVGPDVAITAVPDAVGNEKAAASAKFRRVEVIFQNTNGKMMEQTTMAHETGHLFGYGDEYGDVTTGGGVLPKYAGDEADGTSKAIRNAGMSEDVVKQHRIENNSESIMNRGNVVGIGHYSLFLTQLKRIATDRKTNAKVNWQVEKG